MHTTRRNVTVIHVTGQFPTTLPRSRSTSGHMHNWPMGNWSEIRMMNSFYISYTCGPIQAMRQYSLHHAALRVMVTTCKCNLAGLLQVVPSLSNACVCTPHQMLVLTTQTSHPGDTFVTGKCVFAWNLQSN